MEMILINVVYGFLVLMLSMFIIIPCVCEVGRKFHLRSFISLTGFFACLFGSVFLLSLILNGIML